MNHAASKLFIIIISYQSNYVNTDYRDYIHPGVDILEIPIYSGFGSHQDSLERTREYEDIEQVTDQESVRER